jgi:N-hydroxyarylamine O-acetyltransferase
MQTIDLDAYFGRIGYEGAREATPQVLGALQLAHPGAIPFEGLDPFLGRPVALDPASLERKLVRGGRGGYCFEQNGVFWRVLTALGFEVTPLAARVRWMLPEDAPLGPLTHMLLKVETAEGPVLCDVGFGGQSPTAPLRFEPGLEQATPHGTYRLMPRDDGALDLQMRLPERWQTMYCFTQEPRIMADYELGNWFTSTHPNSLFVNSLVASRVVGERRLNLINTALTTHLPGGGTEERLLASAGELHRALTQDLGLAVDAADAERIFQRLPKPVPATA